tara:strand:- start:141 stop:311 length:171 start_codon:yes stop_codon:yes gene_type:complete
VQAILDDGARWWAAHQKWSHKAAGQAIPTAAIFVLYFYPENLVDITGTSNWLGSVA